MVNINLDINLGGGAERSTGLDSFVCLGSEGDVKCGVRRSRRRQRPKCIVLQADINGDDTAESKHIQPGGDTDERGGRTGVPSRFDSDSAVQRGNADLSVDGGAEAIGLSCVQVRNGTFSFRGGNYSARNGAVQCEEKAVYSYRPNARQLRSPFERGMTSFCKENFCVSVLLADENTLLISEPYDGRSSRNANASFFVTHVHFSLRAARLRWIARNIQQLYSISVLEELELRRQTLLQSQTARCEFEVERREVSMIKGWTFVTALLFWICCVLFFVAMAALKRGVLYDMNNAMHWATRTCHPPGGDSTAAGVVGGRAAAFVRLDSYDSDRPLVSVMATAGTPPPANAQYEEDTTSPQL
ncbi:hypothetical protein BWQ96_00500 [Gracilariopsis chorda]|uniref:Transmembrane protein n=1 Tax=Gracilariopsis chorda TaxID=448386 RepID=A0A2V3J671_9FLOR|nr:hypothetical protein BWQ96_00500 [Gracilariopsis chorda]|eukprot:PXF49622.1 hypothetical protein BWQ96_00500 [Gracilariopsis chorda]